MLAPHSALHSGCDVCRDAAQHELAVVILCGVADGVCLGAKKQNDLVGELLQCPLCGRFQKRGQLSADQKQRRKDSAEIVMEQLKRVLLLLLELHHLTVIALLKKVWLCLNK